MDRRQPVTVRLMMVADVTQVVAIENQVFPLPWSARAFVSEVSENRCATYVVAAVGSRIVGYAGLWAFLDEAHITTIAVHPDYQRQGVGALLLRYVIAVARIREAREMSLEVRVTNSTAIRLYERFGFVQRGVRPGYYGRGEDAIIMHKADIGDKIVRRSGGVSNADSGDRDIMR